MYIFLHDFMKRIFTNFVNVLKLKTVNNKKLTTIFNDFTIFKRARDCKAVFKKPVNGGFELNWSPLNLGAKWP